MPTQNVPSMTPVPTFPSLSERAAGTYNSSALAFGTHMHAVFNAELLAVANNVKYNADDAKSSADTAALSVLAAAAKETAAAASAAAAASSASTAAAAAGGQLWVSGTTYAVGALVFSAVTGRNYRRIVAGAGTTDPSADSTNWRAVLLDAETGLPTIRPSLLLDFTNSRSVDPRITLTRASIATRINARGLIETVAAGVPRIDFDPVTLACKGLLIEESRTNLFTYSEQFDNAAWVKSAASVSANAALAPDGTTTADKLVDTATNSDHSIRQQVSSTSGTAHTLTTYARAGELTQGGLEIFTGTSVYKALFNLSTGAFIASTGSGSSSISQADVGRHRAAVTATSTSATVNGFIYAAKMATTTYTGDGTSGVYGWGAQLEVGDFPTSYIPTTTASATRAADAASITGSNFSNWYRKDEGAFVVFARRDSLSAGRLITLSDGTANNQIRINLAVSSTSLRADLEVVTGGVSQVSTTTTPVFAVGSFVAIAFAYKANDFAISVNGSAVVTDSSGTVPTVDRMHIGTDHAGANHHNGTVARIAYYPKRPTTAELQALSAL